MRRGGLELLGWGLVALSAAAAIAESYASPAALAQLTHADFQYLPALYRDLFEQGGRLSDWVLPPSPYLFPDLVVHALLRQVSSNPDWLTIASAGVLCAAAAVVVGRLAARAAGTEGAALQALVLLSTVLLAYARGLSGEAVGLLCLSSHGAEVVVGLGCLLLASRPSPRRLALATALAFGTTLSDPLFAIAWAVPLAALAAEPPATARQRVVRGAGILAACAVGLLVHELLPVPRPSGHLRLSYLLSGATDFFSHLGGPLALPVSLGLFAAILAVVRARGDPARRSLLLALLLSFPLSLLGLWAIGAPAGSWDSRYLFHLHLALVVMAPAALAGIRAEPWLSRGVAAAGALAAGLTLVERAPNLLKVGQLKLEPVACFDRFVRHREVHRCAASYWLAKPIAVLAERPVTVVQVWGDGRPDWWITTRRHYAEAEDLDCVALPPDQAGFFTERFGRPEELERCEGAWFLFYRGESRLRVSRAVRELLVLDGTRH